MKKYILTEDNTVNCIEGEVTISKGTEVLSGDYKDKDGEVISSYTDGAGKILGTINSGEHKGKMILFNIRQLALKL